jgi:hypothetical protein
MLCAKEEMDMEIGQGKHEQKQERQTLIIHSLYSDIIYYSCRE